MKSNERATKKKLGSVGLTSVVMVMLRSGSRGSVVVARGHLFVLVLGLGLAEEPGEHGGEERLEARRQRLLFPAGVRSHRGSAEAQRQQEAFSCPLSPSLPVPAQSRAGGRRVMVQFSRERGGYGSGRGGTDINERASERCCCQAGRSGSRRRERSGSNGRDSGRVRIATVGRSRSNGWDRSPGKLAVAATASGIRLRAGKGLGFLLRRVPTRVWPVSTRFMT